MGPQIEVRDYDLRPGAKEVLVNGSVVAYVAPYANAEGQAFEIRGAQCGFWRFNFTTIDEAIGVAKRLIAEGTLPLATAE